MRWSKYDNGQRSDPVSYNYGGSADTTTLAIPDISIISDGTAQSAVLVPKFITSADGGWFNIDINLFGHRNDYE